MDRSLTVHVQQSTWPGGNNLPAFPPTFHSGFVDHDINIPATLLLIGYLTTPTSATGVSLSEFWAWVRYLAAVSEDSDLRLTKSFADLDAHQKTILSDDFGMGVPMLWLSQRLSFDQIVDGVYFMRRIAASLSATQRRTAKRGPNKTPDFVAKDASGVWHVVECKGTQSGTIYGNKQLGSVGPPLTGGIAQKRSITFPPSHTGQRLVCGLSLGVEEKVASRLTIIDTEPEEPFKIAESQLYLADDAVARGVMSKALRLSGFEITAEATASPLGTLPSSIRSPMRRREQQREAFVADRNARARDELNREERTTVSFGDGYRGRELNFFLPRPIMINDEKIVRVIVRQGLKEEILQQLRMQPTISEPIFGEYIDSTKSLSETSVDGEARAAKMKIGNIFLSEIVLE